jgi:hypothetical protein
MRRLDLAAALVTAGVTVGFSLPPLHAEPVSAQTGSPGLLCRQSIAAAERGSGIPPHLLAAIGRVESGRRDLVTGDFNPWPWTANAEGQGFFYDSRAAAVAAVRAMQARGIRSIDVGCMQVNLMHHPDAFASLDVAFDPLANTAYAARFLKELYAQSGDWTKATAAYHSATPDIGAEYQRKVLAALPEESRRAAVTAASLATPLAQAWAATLSTPLTGGFARVLRLASPGTGDGPHMIPQPAIGGVSLPGRGLDAYRAAPIGLAYQAPPRRAGG